MSSPLMHAFDVVLDRIDRAVSGIVIVAMAVLTSVVVLQVFFRYVLNDSLRWGWDVPRLCFIWVVLMSIPLGLRYNAHVGIDILLERFSIGGKRMARRFNAVFMLLISVLAGWYGLQLIGQTWDQMMPGLDISVGWFYVGLAISQVHACLHILKQLITGEASPDVLSET